MSMSTVHPSDSNEHSTPLSNNMERRGRGTNDDAPLVRSLSVLDNVDNNDQLPARQPSPIVSRDLISCSMSCVLRDVSCKKSQGRAQPPGPTTPPSRRPSLTFQRQRQDQDQDQEKQSRLPPSPGLLARHGVKVRDFAYESNLPLIPSIPRVRQLVGARPLKRTKRYFEQPDDIFTVDPPSSQSQSAAGVPFQASSLVLDPHESVNQSRPLERKSTEPVIIPERESRRPYRDVGFADLSQIPSGSQATQRSLHYTLTPVTPAAITRTSTFSPASLPFPFPLKRKLTLGGSQESESSTDTPLVTPKGSQTWPTITSDVPASQLDNNNNNNNNNNGSQAPASVHGPTITYSQLGFSPPFSQAPDTDSGAGTADDVGSPQPTEVATSPPQPLLDLDGGGGDDDNNACASASPSPSPTRATTRAARPLTGPGPPLTPTAGAPRYFLRKHDSPGQDHASTPSPHRRRKSSTRAPAPYPGRVPPATRQAAHAAASGSSGRSPRARPLRKTAIS